MFRPCECWKLWVTDKLNIDETTLDSYHVFQETWQPTFVICVQFWLRKKVWPQWTERCKLRVVQDAKVRPRVDVTLHLWYISCLVSSSDLSSE